MYISFLFPFHKQGGWNERERGEKTIAPTDEWILNSQSYPVLGIPALIKLSNLFSGSNKVYQTIESL